MSFPMTRDALNAAVAPPPDVPAPAVVDPDAPPAPAVVDPVAAAAAEVEANKKFVAMRVTALSTMMLNMAKNGKKNHVVQIVRKPLLADIAAGLQVNFPDSKVVSDVEKSTITVDWS